MTIKVKFFAILRDRAGVGETTLELSPGATVVDARRAVCEKFSPIKPMLDRAAFAVNQAYVSPSTKLCDGDELALIPPVSGG